MLKALLRILLVLFGLVILFLIFAQFRAACAVEDFLARKVPPHIGLQYAGIDANAFTGCVTISDITLEIKDRDTGSHLADVGLDALVMTDFHYYDFLFRRTIHADRLTLLRPLVQMRIVSSAKKGGEVGGPVDLKRIISLDMFEIIDGEYILLRNEEDGVKMRATNVDFTMRDARIDSVIIQRKVPIVYEAISLSGEEVFVDIGPYEKIDIARFDLADRSLEVDTILLHSKYDKATLAKVSPREREHISLDVDRVHFSGMEYGFERDTLYIRSDSAVIHRADFALHLDKRERDRNRNIPLYSKRLRDLEVDLDIPLVLILDGRIDYQERMPRAEKAGHIFFDDFDCRIDRLSSTYAPGETTVIEAHATFMGRAPLRLDWNFDFNNSRDAFTAAVDLRGMDMEYIAPFMRSNLGTIAQGRVDRLFFEIHGDDSNSSGEMKMDYSDFKMIVLDKERKRTNLLKTVIGNLIVKNDSDNGHKGYRYGGIDVQRKKDKAFFNYLWLNAKDGISSTLMGDGMAENEDLGE